MQKLVVLCSIFFSLMNMSCSGNEVQPFIPSISKTVTFTDTDATNALKSFNKYFYNPEAHLFYSTTEQQSLGAIWTQAIFWDIVMDAYKRTKDTTWLQMIDDIYQGAYQKYDAFNWENKNTWFIYDDMMWWVISLARAYEITGNSVYLNTSVAGFNRVWRDSYDSTNGGMYWSFSHDIKNACINYPTVIAAMTLYNITKDMTYFDKAKKIYAWSKENLFDNKTGCVADHKNGNEAAAFSECYTYNQGTCIGAAVMLYKATNDTTYLNDAKLAADYTKKSMCDIGGILPAEGDWNEQGVLKAIFAHYIMEFINDCGQTQYLEWIRDNIKTGWSNRDKARQLTYRNYTVSCPSGVIQSYEASSVVEFMQVCPPK